MELDQSEYLVLGFCSPSHAHKAIAAEPIIGLLLPCNVVVAAKAEGGVEVAAIDPYAILGIAQNKEGLRPLVDDIRAKLRAALDGVLA